MSDPSDQPRRRRRQQAPAPPQGSVARGAILVAVAVVIGFLLLRDEDAVVATGPIGAETDADDSGDDGGDDPDETTTTTTEAPLPPAQVKVLVANGSSVTGAAGAQTDQLEALGYVTGTPTNADGTVPATIVYYQAGFEAEAAALATAIGAPATAVAAMPPVPPVDDLQLANLLVVVGPDIATSG